MEARVGYALALCWRVRPGVEVRVQCRGGVRVFSLGKDNNTLRKDYKCCAFDFSCFCQSQSGPNFGAHWRVHSKNIKERY